MISSVLCPFLPALEGVHIPGFNQLLLLFLGMQFSTRLESLWSIEILPFAARVAQIETPSLKSYSTQVLCCLAPACSGEHGVSQPGAPASSPCICRWGRESRSCSLKCFLYVFWDCAETAERPPPLYSSSPGAWDEVAEHQPFVVVCRAAGER